MLFVGIMRSDDTQGYHSPANLVHNLRPGTAYPANRLHTLRGRCSRCSPDRSRRT